MFSFYFKNPSNYFEATYLNERVLSMLIVTEICFKYEMNMKYDHICLGEMLFIDHMCTIWMPGTCCVC